MAYRIHDQVVRGAIDNTVRGRTVGRIWLAGRAEPIELSLTGNAWRDLAGRRIEFTNSTPVVADTPILTTRQKGLIGDCTASRKVKVPDVSDEELMRLMEARQAFPWHWGNSLYLEWFSETNGRVVLESASYQITLIGEAAWEMTEEEELAQREANARALRDVMHRPGEIDSVSAGADPAAAWKRERPMTEAEADALQAESDRLADRIQARLDREGPDADYERILIEEIERRARERGEPPLTPQEESECDDWFDEMNRAAEAAPEAGEFDQDLDRKHPLVERARELGTRVYRYLKDRSAIPEGCGPEHPLVELVSGTTCAGPILAGALNGRAWPLDLDECAPALVRIKRAVRFLDDALLAANDCVEQGLADSQWLTGVRDEIESVRQAGQQLIAELRARLETIDGQ